MCSAFSVLVFISVFLFLALNSLADVNFYLGAQQHFPPGVKVDKSRDAGVLQEFCHDLPECNRMTLEINQTVMSDGQVVRKVGHQTLNLVKRFELILAKQNCSYYIGSTPKRYAAISFCTAGKKSKKFEGTFFDETNARYDFMLPPDKKLKKDAYTITKVSLKGVKNWHGVPEFDKPFLKDRAGDAVETEKKKWKPPVLGHFKRPTIELQVGVDNFLAAYFRQNEENIIKFVCMVVNNADAMYSQMKIDVKLVGLRFWTKHGHVPPKVRSFGEYGYEVWAYAYTNVLMYMARFGPEKIRGVPDVMLTFTQAFARDDHMGVAIPYDPLRGSWGLIKAVWDSFLTEHYVHPHRLHHFATGITTAHEMGHSLLLNHSEKGSGCFIDEGECIMSSTYKWALPFWTKTEEAYIKKGLNTTHSFLMEQNVRHNTIGSVHKYVPSMTPFSKKVFEFVTGLCFIFLVYIAFMYHYSVREWRKILGSGSHVYQRLESEKEV